MHAQTNTVPRPSPPRFGAFQSRPNMPQLTPEQLANRRSVDLHFSTFYLRTNVVVAEVEAYGAVPDQIAIYVKPKDARRTAAEDPENNADPAKWIEAMKAQAAENRLDIENAP